jgi:hypothetical protein
MYKKVDFLCWHCLDKIRFQKLKRNVFCIRHFGQSENVKRLEFIIGDKSSRHSFRSKEPQRF